MEFYKINGNRSVFRVSGNSRIKVLNDFEKGLIHKDLIEFKFGEMYLTTYVSNENGVIYKKNYTTMEFRNGIPNISYFWDFDLFTPYYITQPIIPVSPETLLLFNINRNSKLCYDLCNIDMHELTKNERILNLEYDEIEFWDELKYGKKYECEITHPDVFDTYESDACCEYSDCDITNVDHSDD